MYALNTKASRDSVREFTFSKLIEKGYTRETYKGLNIFTKHDTDLNRYYLELFIDNSTKNVNKYYYRDTVRMNEVIDGYKKSYDRREDYKKANPPRQTGAAACASAIREELKKAFSDIKFSVRSSNFAGGDSVDISWSDGPTRDMVEDITRKYQHGHFDGMNDIYEYSNSRSDIPQSKYVMCQRSMSKEVEAKISEIALPYFEKGMDGCWDINNFAYRLFCDSPIKSIDQICGVHIVNGRFALKLTEPEKKEVKALPAKVETAPGTINVIKYSEKSVAVVGDTKPIKDSLKELGGVFNFRLSCGPGWIFSMSKLESLKSFLQTVQSPA